MLTKGQQRFLDLGYEVFGYEGMTDRLIQRLEKLTPEEVETTIGEERLIKLFSVMRPDLSESEIRELLKLPKEPTKRKRRAKADPDPQAESK
jgi:hypothetical protein